MAGLSTRSRRNTQNNQGNQSDEIVPTPTVPESPVKGKSRNNSRSSKNLITEQAANVILATSPIESATTTVSEMSTTEMESSITAGPSATEEVSSNTSESGSRSSDKSSSETSVTSDETLNKTKDELIRTAHDLDSQFQELINIYKDEKKIFLDKSINLLETGTHPDWLERIEELRSKRHDALKIANERHRLKVESIIAEYDFALKNISDEFQAAENEIIDEFTTKRKRRAEKEFPGLEKIEKAIDSPIDNFKTSDKIQVQNDLSAINRIIENHAKTVVKIQESNNQEIQM